MIDIAESNRRLLVLAAKLRTVPEEHFWFGQWCDLNSIGQPDVCGTAGCAVGWACEIPEFQALGLRLGLVNGRASFGRPEFNGDEGFPAARSFFGLTEEDTYLLFEPIEDENVLFDEDEDERLPANSTTTEVADHIEAFVRGRAS